MLSTTPADPVAECLADVLQLRVDHIGRKNRKSLDSDRRLALARILLDAVRGRRLPRHYNDPQAVAISAQELRRRLRSDVAAIRNALLRLISTFKDSSFDVGGRTTRAITLHPAMMQQATQVYLDAATAPLEVVTQSKETAPTRWHGAIIPGVLPEVTLEMANRAIASCDSQDIETFGALVDARYSIALHSGLSNVFDEETTAGRLKPVGVVSLVSMPRTARALLLQDTGWVDYDLSSCHLTILRDLGRHLGLSTSAIERYLTDKTTAHAAWATEIDHDDPDDFKWIVLSFQNGARQSVEKETKLGTLLGHKKATRWLQRPYVQTLLTEISEIVRPVVTQARVGKKKSKSYSNVLGLIRDGATWPQACNHIWTGYEVWIMRELLKRLQVLQPGALKVYIYDGFISGTSLSDEQIADLESHVRRRSLKVLGVELSITLKATPFVATNTSKSSHLEERSNTNRDTHLEPRTQRQVETDRRAPEEHSPEMQAWLAEERRKRPKHIDKE